MSKEDYELMTGLTHIFAELEHFNILLEHWEADFQEAGITPVLTPRLQRKRFTELRDFTAKLVAEHTIFLHPKES